VRWGARNLLGSFPILGVTPAKAEARPSTSVAFPSSGPPGHLLPDGEKNPAALVIGTIPLPDGERVDRPQGRDG